MSKRLISSSCTDWTRLSAIHDEDIDLSEIPEVTEEQVVRAKLRVDGQFALSLPRRTGNCVAMLLQAFCNLIAFSLWYDATRSKA